MKISRHRNPFNPTTTLVYQLPQDRRVKVVVYDILGREVRRLVEEVKVAGYYSVQFDAPRIASRISLLRMLAEPVGAGKGFTAVKN